MTARPTTPNSPEQPAGQSLAAATCSASFGVIYADPPWAYNESGGGNRTVAAHYQTMQQAELCAMEIPAAEDSILFMWATAPKLPEAVELMAAWGFRYKSHAVWDKVKIGMGYWFRGQHELLMVGIRGKVSPPPAHLRISSVIRRGRGRHSAKPEEVRDWIARCYPDVPKLEMFSRLKRPGWEVFGNQVEYDLLSGEDLYGQNTHAHPPDRAG